VSASRAVSRAALGIALVACATEPPTASDPIPAPLVAVSAGVLHTCGSTGSGAVFCWGWNAYGQVGDGSRRDRPFPVLVHTSTPLAEPSTAAGAGHTCGVAAGGAAYCWGFNLSGQLGDGSQSTRLVPTPIAGGLTIATLDAGGAYTCAAAADSSAHCWGWNLYGQLGDGTRTDRPAPTPVGGGLRLVSVVVGTQHSCARAADSTLYCWGRNGSGQLGDGSTTDTTLPVAVAGGLKFAAIAVGVSHSCGLTAVGAAYCWGDNTLGQLGDTAAGAGASEPRAVAGGLVFVALAAGGTHTCGVVAGSGAAHCWGAGASGQLGGPPTNFCVVDGLNLPCAKTPVAVDGGLSFRSLTGGQHHTCGLTTGGIAYCWGLNDHGQLGDGTTRSRVVPVRVANQLTGP